MAFEMTYEELVPVFEVHCLCEVIELDAPHQPTNIIRTDQRWAVRFSWNTEGALNYIMAGTWHLQVFLEKMGLGEFDLDRATRDVTFVAQQISYTEQIDFPARSVPVGIYKLVAAITFSGPPPDKRNGPIALFGEGPMIQFYDVTTGPLETRQIQ
jgi:hypothetical protein